MRVLVQHRAEKTEEFLKGVEDGNRGCSQHLCERFLSVQAEMNAIGLHCGLFG